MRHIRLDYTVFLVIAAVLAMTSCSHAPRSACEGDLSKYEGQARCHDEAFFALKTRPDSSMTTLRALCDSNKLARACSNAAHAYENPSITGNTPDYSMSREYYQKGCNLGDGVACHNLANLHIIGRGGPADDKTGVRHLEQACSLNYAAACYRLAVITQRGKVVPSDPVAAADLLQKGCDLGDAASCHDLGYLYLEGNGVKRDGMTARDLISLSCDQGLPRGCGSLGWLYMQEKSGIDYDKALELLQTACAGDDAPSCSNLGYLIETGNGVAADPARAAQYYSKACHGGDLLGCGNLGVLLSEGRGVPRDDLTAFPLLERGCSDSASESCRYVAIFHEEGRAGLPRSEVTARFFRTKACEYGDEPSCSLLAKGFESLCGSGEQTVLACMTGQTLLVSLCSKDTPSGATTLVYRFGTSTTVDLAYSGDFRLTEDNWTNGDSHTLDFANGSARYAMVETMDNSQDPPSKRVEIAVENDGQTTRIPCRYPIIGSLDSDAIRKGANLSPAGE
jgi:TPR repeat protein